MLCARRNDDVLGIHSVDEGLSTRRLAAMMRRLQDIGFERSGELRFQSEQCFLYVPWCARRRLRAYSAQEIRDNFWDPETDKPGKGNWHFYDLCVRYTAMS